jgi:hypothetical protein
MRRQLLDALDAVPRAGFLCYLVGPGESADALPRRAVGPPESDADDLLREVRDRLRAGPGVNAFVADDLGFDAAPRSVQLARASNAVAVIAPDLGVPARTASVLDDAAESDRLDRVALVHEAVPGSTTTASLADGRSVTAHSYGDSDELVFRLRAFVLGVMHREARGDLPTPA